MKRATLSVYTLIQFDTVSHFSKRYNRFMQTLFLNYLTSKIETWLTITGLQLREDFLTAL